MDDEKFDGQSTILMIDIIQESRKIMNKYLLKNGDTEDSIKIIAFSFLMTASFMLEIVRGMTGMHTDDIDETFKSILSDMKKSDYVKKIIKNSLYTVN
jgi:hypothetical protein